MNRVLVLALWCCGCLIPDAKPPVTGAVATGEPLLVVDDVKVWSTVSHDKVAEVRVEDESGQRLATGSVYADRTHVHEKLVWFPVQGDKVIPDEDFFRIAGDHDAVDATLQFRERNQAWNRRGKITMVVGAVALLLTLPIKDPLARSMLALGGGLGIAGGWYLTIWSHNEQLPENHAVDRSVAADAAEKYNAQHRSASLGVSRSF